MIDAKDAVKIARDYFQSMFEGNNLSELLLEETDLIEDGKFWLITFGFDWTPTSGTSSIGPGDRKHKAVRLDAETGSLVSMKIVNINA